MYAKDKVDRMGVPDAPATSPRFASVRVGAGVMRGSAASTTGEAASAGAKEWTTTARVARIVLVEGMVLEAAGVVGSERVGKIDGERKENENKAVGILSRQCPYFIGYSIFRF